MKKVILFLVFLMTAFVCEYVSASDKLAPAGSKQGPEIFVQMGHSGSTTITSIVFSPDGKYILSGGGDKAIKLWETATGREVRTLREHSDSIGQVVFSDDGKFALSKDTAFMSSSLIQWDIVTGKTVKKNKVFPSRSAFTSNGKYIVGEEEIHDISLWDAATGKKIKTLKDTRNFPKDKTFSIEALSISGNNRYAISSYQPGILKIWDLSSGKFVKELKNENVKASHYIAVSHTGKFFLSAGFGKDEKMSLMLWDMGKGKVIRTVFTCISGGSAFGVFSPDEKYILFSKDNNEKGEFFLCLEELETGRELWCSEGHSTYITSAAFAQDGKSVITGGWDHTLKLWDIAAGKNIRTFSGDVTFSSFGYSPKNNLMLTGASIWDISAGKTSLAFQGVDAAYLMLSPDGRSVLAKEQKLLFNIETGKWTGVFPEEQGNLSLQKTVFSQDGRYILSGFDGKLKLWDIDNAKTVKIFKAHDEFPGIEAIAFSPDGRFILSGGMDNKQSVLKLWNAHDGRNIWSVKLSNIRASSLDFSPDGKYILLGDGVNNRPVLYNAANGNKIKEFKHSDIYRSRIECVVAFSPDGKYALSADLSDNRVVLWDVGTGKEAKTFEGHSGGVYSLAFLQDRKRFLSRSYDGTTRLWDISTGKEIAQFISFTDGEWVVITPEGYFNASPNGAKYLNVRVGNNVYSIDNFYEKFFNPVYVASVLQGKKVETVADIRKGILTPPDVKIISPEPNKEFSADTISITVSAKDTGGGIDEIRLYHNGKAIGEDTRAVKVVPKGNETIKTYTISLVDGTNTFRAVGFSKDRTESNPYELIVKLTAPSKDVSLYVLAIGVNKYKNPALNLNYAEPDAQGIVNFFRQKGGLFKKVNVIEIYDEQATKENIISKLNQLQATHPQDAVLIYLAGHGENISDKWYFIPHELTYPEREDDVKTKGISSDELAGYIKNIKAQKILVLIDACKSGAVLVAFRGFEDRKALSQLSRATGVHIIAASTKDQFAAEVKDLGHGVFTYTLLEGLKGKAAGGGEMVTVFKLKAYLDEQLPEITKKYKQEAQYPVGDTKGMDFPLALTK